MRCWLIAALGLTAAGCAPALSSFTPAHVAPRHHVQAEVGMDVSIPTGTLSSVVDAGEALVDAGKRRELSQSEQERLFEAGLALALNPPSVTPHVGVAYSLFEHFEIGGRYSVGAMRLAARYQLLEQSQSGVDFSAGLGLGRYVYEFPISDQLQLLKLEDFQRWQIDIPLLVGQHGDWYRWWAGPRALFTFYGTELVYEQPEIPGSNPEKKVLASLDGSSVYLGGQAGAAVGYKHVFFAFELTLAESWNHAKLDAFGEHRDVQLDSFIVYPGFGLLGEF